jgi:hypothetical protein
MCHSMRFVIAVSDSDLEDSDFASMVYRFPCSPQHPSLTSATPQSSSKFLINVKKECVLCLAKIALERHTCFYTIKKSDLLCAMCGYLVCAVLGIGRFPSMLIYRCNSLTMQYLNTYVRIIVP